MKKVLFVLLVMVTAVFGLSEKNEKYVSDLVIKYKAEWKIMTPESKEIIHDMYYKGDVFGLGYTAGSITFIETRGYPNRINTNISSKGKVLSYDCGYMGTNTYYYLKRQNIKPTQINQMEACLELNTYPIKSFINFLDTIEDGKKFKHIKDLKRKGLTKSYYRHLWNFYNTGDPDDLKGNYYLKMIAAIRVLKQVLNVDMYSQPEKEEIKEFLTSLR